MKCCFFGQTLKCHVRPCPAPPKGIVPPLKVNTVAVLNRPSFVLLSRIKCCAAPAAIREAFIIFLSVPASFLGRFRHVYGCPCQPAFLPCLHQWATVNLFGLMKLRKEKSVLGGLWTCQTVLLGVVGIKEEVGWREALLGGCSKCQTQGPLQGHGKWEAQSWSRIMFQAGSRKKDPSASRFWTS